MVGLCIKYFFANYGGMLQAYATTKIFEEMGIDYELVRYQKKDSLIKKVCNIPRLFNSVLINDKKDELKKKKMKKQYPQYARNDAIRKKAFKRFEEKNFIKLAPISVGYDELCQNSTRYDVVVTGSDQLWSPAGLPTNYYNLHFVKKGIKRVSYASSFGVSQIPWYQIGRTKKFLNDMDCISMRENRGAEIVKELTGKDVPVVLDPVFMHSKEKWEEYIPYKRTLEEPYILAYFLTNNDEYKVEIKKFAKEKNLKIVELQNMHSEFEFGDEVPFDVGPEEFLNYIRNAAYVCTDSFHGTVFSIIHQKQFLVFDRYAAKSKVSKNSRIDTLCSNLGLQERRYSGKVIGYIEKDIDYENVVRIIEEEKGKAYKYLEASIKK